MYQKMMLLKQLYMMNWIKKLMLLRLLIRVIQFKKLNITQKLEKLKRKYLTMINITSPEFNKLVAKNFAERLKQVKLADDELAN